MFYEDTAAQQYEVLLTLTSTFVGGPILGMSSEGSDTITWGMAYDSTPVTGHGIKVVLKNYYDTLLNPVHDAWLIIPHMSINDVTITGAAGHISPYASLLQFDDVDLTGACTSKDLTWTELRWYLGGVLIRTVAGTTNTASPYDPRLNRILRVPVGAEGLVPSLGVPSCASAVAKYEGKAVLTKGWRHDAGAGWVNEPIRLISAHVPPPKGGKNASACPCQTALSGVSGTDCYNVTLTGDMIYQITDTPLGTVTCPCCQGPGTHSADRILKELDFTVIDVWAVLAPTNKSLPILKHSEVGRAMCADLNTGVLTDAWIVESSTVTDTATTVAAPYKEAVAKMHGETWCYTTHGVDPCTVIIDPGDPCFGRDPCDTEEYVLACQYNADFTVDWPEKPPCGSTEIFSDVHADWGHIRTYVSGSTIHVGKRDNPVGSPWVDADTGITGTDVSIRYDRGNKTKTARLLYIDASGDLIEAVETNNSGTFS